MLVIFNAFLRFFERVVNWAALVVPTTCDPKERRLGNSVTLPAVFSAVDAGFGGSLEAGDAASAGFGIDRPAMINRRPTAAFRYLREIAFLIFPQWLGFGGAETRI